MQVHLTKAGLNGCTTAQGGRIQGLTLPEVVISVAIVAVVFGGVVTAYIQAGYRLAWSGYSIAAQSLALSMVEQTRSSVWDPVLGINQVTNLNVLTSSYDSVNLIWTGSTTNVLDVPGKGTNYVNATLNVTVQMLNVNYSSNVFCQNVRVDCVWPFTFWKGQTTYFTNTICTILAPDNRDPSTF